MEYGQIAVSVCSTILVMVVLWLLRFSIGRLISYLLPLSARDIRGRWETTFRKGDKEFTEIAVLSQFGSNVWGKIELTIDNVVRKYQMRGKLKGDIITATYETISPSDVYDRGAFTLIVARDGQTLNGSYAWTDDKNTTPQCDDYEWKKKRA